MSSESDNSLVHILSPGSSEATENASASVSSAPEAVAAPVPGAPEPPGIPQEPAAPQTGQAPAHSAPRVDTPRADTSPEPREEARALAIVLEPSERLGTRSAERPHLLRRWGPAAAVVAAFSAVALLALAGPLSAPPDPATASLRKPIAAAAAAPIPPQRDPKLEAVEMAGEIRSLSMGLATLRAKLEVMRANSETMAGTLEAVRAGLDRNHPGEDARALKKSLDALREALDQVKAEQSAALTQIGQRFDRLEHDPSLKSAPIADRLDRLEHDQETRLASLGERLDRLERRANIAQDVTGSITRPSVPPPTPANHGDPEAPPTTTARAEQAPLPSPPVIPGLYVRDAEGNAALIRGPGGLFEIARGEFIQGVGRVEAIERRGRGWVVVTSRGIIESERR